MKKGIAIPYIIAILLGIVVISLIGYLFYVSTAKLEPEECRTRLGTYCSTWVAGGRQVAKPVAISWAIVPSIITDTSDDDTIKKAWNSYAPGCIDYGIEPTESACKAIVG